MCIRDRPLGLVRGRTREVRRHVIRRLLSGCTLGHMTSRDWHRTSSRAESDLGLFRVRRDIAVSPRTGNEHEFVVLESADWVAVVALTEDDRLVLVRQFRHGLREVTLELPGGLVDAGMTPEEAARAELRQETGYGGGEWAELGRLAPLPAVLTNQVHVFLARGVRLQGDPEPDPGEDIATELVLVEDARLMVARGEITHAPVVAALFLWDLEARSGGSSAVTTHVLDAPTPGEETPGEDIGSLRDRILAQLRSHFTLTVATVGSVGVESRPVDAAAAGGADEGAEPGDADEPRGADETRARHAATVFYACLLYTSPS